MFIYKDIVGSGSLPLHISEVVFVHYFDLVTQSYDTAHKADHTGQGAGSHTLHVQSEGSVDSSWVHNTLVHHFVDLMYRKRVSAKHTAEGARKRKAVYRQMGEDTIEINRKGTYFQSKHFQRQA